MKTFVNYIVVIALSLIGMVPCVSAQDSSGTEGGRSVYRQSWTMGFKVHTSGIGGEFRREKFVGAKNKNFWNWIATTHFSRYY